MTDNNSFSTNEEVLSVREVADSLGYSERTIRDYLKSGKLKGYKIHNTGKWLIPKSEVYTLEKPLSNEASQTDIQDIEIRLSNLEQSQQADTLVLEAQKEHLSDIQNLIERWKESIFIPHSSEITPNKFDRYQ